MMLITAQGMMIMMAVSDVRVIGRATQGVRLINLDEGDKLVSATTVEPEDREFVEPPPGLAPAPVSPVRPFNPSPKGRRSRSIRARSATESSSRRPAAGPMSSAAVTMAGAPPWSAADPRRAACRRAPQTGLDAPLPALPQHPQRRSACPHDHRWTRVPRRRQRHGTGQLGAATPQPMCCR